MSEQVVHQMTCFYTNQLTEWRMLKETFSTKESNPERFFAFI